MDIDQFRQFLAVARLNNFTRAAKELGLSQPALSRSIQRLEEEFGQPLLERKTRSVELTDAGILLQTRATEVLRIIEDTKAQITDDGQSGRLRIGAIPTVAPYFLPGFLRQFGAEFPQASLVVQEDTTEILLGRCKQGELDLAVLALPIAQPYVEVQPLMEEELLLVLPKEHPLIEPETVRPDDIEPYPFVLLGEAHCLSESVVSFCRQRSFQPVVVERTSQLVTVQELVSLGHGVSMIPAMARRLDQSDQRVYRSIEDPTPTRVIAMVWNPYRFESRLLIALRERLVEYATQQGERP